MVAAYTDISDSNFGGLSATHFDRASCIEIDHMNCLWGCLGNWLNNDVVEAEFMDLIVQ